MMINKSWWLLIAAALLLSLQVLAVVIYIYSLIPLVWNDPFLKGVEPERETFFYALFLLMSTIFMAGGVKWILPKLNSSEYHRKFNIWLVMECLWCFLMVFIFFKWTTYRYPCWSILPYENATWLQPFFCGVCGLAVLSKIFFPETVNFYSRLETYIGKRMLVRRDIILFQIIFIGLMITLIYIPRPQEVTALALAWDQWNHLDQVAGWFIKHGWYMNYEETIQLLVMMSIVYVVGLFYFIRLWLNSWLLSGIGVLLTIKMGLFYYGGAPCIWINPANTFLSHGWDIVLFFGLWFVLSRYPQRFYTVAALTGIGITLIWFKSSGYIDALGLDNQPMMAPLRVRQFFPYFMGYCVPVFYVFSLLILMGQKNVQQRWLPLALCIYGLMIFSNYVEHPAIGYYGSLMVPTILVMLWWFKEILSSSTMFIKRMTYIIVFMICLMALLTNRLMMVYPNIFFQDSQRFSREKAFNQQFDAVTKSAGLIDQLTKGGEKVVVLSNFETALLMQAHRMPVFTDFPVMFSSFSTAGGLNIITKEQGLRLINNMADENASYVFVDQRLWVLSPAALGNGGLSDILGYVRGHYQEYASQGFLVALQRR